MDINGEKNLLDISIEDESLRDSSSDNSQPTNITTTPDKSSAKRPKPNLQCVVCGDHAFGYNFDAISCESCKAFFRRNALRPLGKFKCRGNGNCSITVEKRKRCKKCRLDECFRKGMRKEWILTEEEKQEKKRKIEENRRQKQLSQDTINRRKNSIQRSNAQQQISRHSFDLSATENIPPMSENDWGRIQRIQTAYNQSIALNKVIGVPLYPASHPINSTLELIRVPTYLASIRLITFFKNIPEFSLCEPDDRVALVKYNLLAVVVMHIVLLYDPIADTYHEYNTEDPIFQGNDWIQIVGKEFYQELTNFATELIEIFQFDRVIVKIFLLLILTSKAFCAYEIELEPTLKNHSTVLDTQNLYLESLYKYCLHHYGIVTTIKLFARTINSLFTIQNIAFHLKDYVHDHVNASQLSPLMQSVLQLNN